MKRLIPLLVIMALVVPVSSASVYKYTQGGKQYVASLEGGGVINPNLTFNMSNGYLVPDNPNNTYTVYGTIDSYDTQAWMGKSGGGITIMVDTNPKIFTNRSHVFKQWYQAGTPINQQTIGYAESINGINWTDYTSNPLSGVGYGVTGSVVKYGDTYYMFRTDTNAMDILTSSDGLSWSLSQNDIITRNVTWGSNSMWYEHVWNEGSNWYMLYAEWKTNGEGANGLATASSITGPWTEYSGNPIITRSGGQVGLPSKVFKDSKGYYWLYVGCSDTPSTASYKSYGARYRSVNPNNLTAWVQNPNSSIYEGAGVNETSANAHRQAGFGIPIRYDNKTYIYGNYAVQNWTNNYVGDTHLGLVVTPLTLEQIISTNEKYPDLKGVMGI